MFDFDEVIDRRNTYCIKYDFAVKRGKPEGLLPLWVADMDFKSPDCVIRALEEKCSHGIFGYSDSDEGYFDVLKDWFSEQFNWDIKNSWLVQTPGVVYAVSTAIRALTDEGDSVLIQQPVYYPFAKSIHTNDRKLAVNQLVYSGGEYSIDLEDFENKIIENNVKLFILCNPHNPVGRVWTKVELIAMGDICLKHGVIVVSDEIHADFIFPGYKHVVFADIKPEYSDITVTCTAPSKTFNLAGLQVSNIFISNSELISRFKNEMAKSGYGHLNVMGLVACKAAYSEGREWLEELKRYLCGNLDYLRCFLKQHTPQVKLVEPQGTYLVWLDFSELGLSDKQLDNLMVHKAHLWLDAGTMFGAGGEGFQRINIACPRSVLKQALSQLEQAVNSL